MNEMTAPARLLHCACDAPAMAFYAGTADETVALMGQQLVLVQGVPAAAWCETHWLAKFGDYREAPASSL